MATKVLLINMGTPASPKTADVRRYLTEFLNDARVIDLPWLGRKLLVNLIIVPFRAPKSAHHYKELWTEKGSPLMYHSLAFNHKLEQELGEEFELEILMRYGKPSLKDKLKKLEAQYPEKLVIIPLYPQYASSTTGSALELIYRKISAWKQIPEIRTLHHFHDHKGFIQSIVERLKTYGPGKECDHIVMSYHGLPENHVHEAHEGKDCKVFSCTEKRDEHNKFCYLASCYETSRLIAAQLSLNPEDYTVSFQSRMSKNWTKPFTEDLVLDLASKGAKKILVVSPAFVADCLETTHELGVMLKKKFVEAGGEQLTLVDSLNDQDSWVKVMASMVRELSE